jgi:hypothetical protein
VNRSVAIGILRVDISKLIELEDSPDDSELLIFVELRFYFLSASYVKQIKVGENRTAIFQ